MSDEETEITWHCEQITTQRAVLEELEAENTAGESSDYGSRSLNLS